MGTPPRRFSDTVARAVAVELGLPGAESPGRMTMATVTNDDDVMEEEQTKTEETWLFHCAGGAYGLVLGDLLESRYKVRMQDCNGLYMILHRSPPAGPLQFSANEVVAHLRRRWRQFESWYDLGCFQSQLPLEARRRTLIDAFGVAEFLHTFSGCSISEEVP